MIKLSIIIPVYNVEKYIEKCVLSVLNNDLDKATFEILIIDDESQDNSINKINHLVQSHNNIHLFSQINKGLGGARNTGIHKAKGEYLLFLDADDVVLPTTLKHIVSLAFESELDVLEFGAKGVTEENQEIYRIKNTTNGVILNGIDYYNTIRYMNSACNKLYRKDFLRTNELFFLEKIFIEDFEFNTRVFTLAKKVLATDYLVSSFLQTPNSITRNNSQEKKEKMINDIIFVLKKTIDLQKTLEKNKNSNLFFEERKSFLVATLFFQLVKNKATHKEMLLMKNKLKANAMFCVTHFIHDKNKNWFRIIVVKNLWIYTCIKPILNYII